MRNDDEPVLSFAMVIKFYERKKFTSWSWTECYQHCVQPNIVTQSYCENLELT